jgi:hypothetical protein
MPMYLVVCDLPGLTPDEFGVARRAMEAAASQASVAGIPVRSVWGVFVPSEGCAIFQFEGPDVDSVRAVNMAAGVPLSLVEALECAAELRTCCANSAHRYRSGHTAISVFRRDAFVQAQEIAD